MKITIPGAFWLALLAFITLWLPDLVPGAPWLPEALLILTAIGKALQVYIEAQQTNRGLGEVTVYRGKFSRWLWG